MLQQLIFTLCCTCLREIIGKIFFLTFYITQPRSKNANQRRMAEGDSAPSGTKALGITTRALPALNAASRYAN